MRKILAQTYALRQGAFGHVVVQELAADLVTHSHPQTRFFFWLGVMPIKHQCYRNKFMVRWLKNLFKRHRFEIYQELKCTYSIAQSIPTGIWKH